MLVFRGVGNTSSYMCVPPPHTETAGLTVINELPQWCYFSLDHWNNAELEAQLGQRSNVPLLVALSLFLPPVKDTNRQVGQIQALLLDSYLIRF